MSNPDVSMLLEEIREYKENNVVGWKDYEHFKQLFINLGIYGYEKDIADALDL